ncbi:site-specific DNA-methyltransferase [Dolichospermum circinale]|uniref:site-specific DNA-methyltransferase n=1 Tax=Dolichospermum circinale TaxID=109265 RepID=UPI00232D3BB1|nr:site-specific DNA-methyltransferase [Dolichospermum circinale]MDB9468562.1 site-specific DNA-methyltransferase [Dolichospermum circinale CS-539/09]MDB9470794.1 site-specific DNA-methyltransferase [Dolichospermum circinale CS-539]
MNRKEIEKVETTSINIAAEQKKQLKAIFPEVFTEDKIDFAKLQATLGEIIDDRPERYSFTWAGKREAIQMLQTPSKATLKPDRNESVDFDNTQNLFIEGDNLEVLKLLRKSYSGQVKMIYIDPPYNTGNDFIYPDNYTDPLDNYLELTGQKDSEGNLKTSNPETSGRYHSAWLSMMYPRLFLARQLLRDDGVIFVSIDDHEVHNLRLLMNEVFGEENFIGKFIVQSNPRGSQSNKFSALVHEYLLIFSRNSTVISSLGQELSNEMREEYSFEENGKKYRLLGLRQRGGAWKRSDRPLLYYPLYVDPSNGKVSLSKDETYSIEIFPIKPTTLDDGTWRWNKSKVSENLSHLVGRKINRDNQEVWDIYQKDFLENDNGEERLTKPKTIWNEKEMNYQNGTTEVKILFNGKDYFNFPKPTSLIKKIIKIGCAEDGIILDFFAGSGTTAHAVLDINSEDGNDRRFIVVQLPEKTDNEDFLTIADISKERIRRSIQKIKSSENGKLPLQNRETPEDLGFKVLKLSKSNYRQSAELPSDTETEAYIEQLELFNDPLVDGWKPENVIYEVMLKQGYSLTSRIEQVTEIESATIYKVTDEDKRQHFYISLDNQFHFETARTLKLTKNDLLICRDMAIDDTTAANLVLQCRLTTI